MMNLRDFWHRREFWLLCAALSVSLFAWSSLGTYDAGDTESYPETGLVRNFCGRSGAVFASVSYRWFGMLSWIAPLGILCPAALAASGMRFCRMHASWGFGAAMLFLWGCVFASSLDGAALRSDCMPSRGGLFGLFLLTSLQERLGNSLTALALFAGFALLASFGCTLWIERAAIRSKSAPRS